MGEASTGTPSLIPKEIKVEKPSTFTGRHADLSNFLFEMKQYIDTVGLGNDGKACRFLVSYLKGDALTWWRSFSAHRPDVFSQLTLDVLIDALEEQFQDIDRDLKLRDKLLKLHQTGTVQQFVTQFKQLQLELGKEAFGNELALHCFTQGLKPLTR